MAKSTVQQLALAYIDGRARRHELARTSVKAVRWALLSFCASAPDDVRRLKRRHVESWLAGQDVNPNTLHGRWCIVRTFCRWLAVNGYAAKDVTLGMPGPRRHQALPRSLPADEVGSVFDACPDARARLIVSLMVHEGLRRAEVAGLEVGDIDGAGRIMLVRGKGGSQRWLPITEATDRALSAYLAEHPATSGPLVRSYQYPHRPVTPDHIGRLVAEWMTVAGVKRHARDGRSAHAFRHTAASDVLDNGAHIRQVQLMLGHASLQTTQVYLRRSDAAALREVMDGRVYGRRSATVGGPVFDVGSVPDASAAVEDDDGPREGGGVGELVDALSADAEHVGDFVYAD